MATPNKIFIKTIYSYINAQMDQTIFGICNSVFNHRYHLLAIATEMHYQCDRHNKRNIDLSATSRAMTFLSPYTMARAMQKHFSYRFPASAYTKSGPSAAALQIDTANCCFITRTIPRYSNENALRMCFVAHKQHSSRERYQTKPQH